MKQAALILLTLILVAAMFGCVADYATAPRQQLEPLPSLESKPDYMPDTEIMLVHC